MSDKWYIGQPIVAIRAQSQGAFKKGHEFTIRSLQTCPCNKHVIIDIGISSSSSIGLCVKSNIEYPLYGIWYFHENMFAPLDTDISELTEILEKELVNKDYEK